MKLSIFAACLPALAYAASLDARRPVCSGEGGKCDTGLFECCVNDPYLYCVSFLYSLLPLHSLTIYRTTTNASELRTSKPDYLPAAAKAESVTSATFTAATASSGTWFV